MVIVIPILSHDDKMKMQVNKAEAAVEVIMVDAVVEVIENATVVHSAEEVMSTALNYKLGFLDQWFATSSDA